VENDGEGERRVCDVKGGEVSEFSTEEMKDGRGSEGRTDVDEERGDLVERVEDETVPPGDDSRSERT